MAAIKVELGKPAERPGWKGTANLAIPVTAGGWGFSVNAWSNPKGEAIAFAYPAQKEGDAYVPILAPPAEVTSAITAALAALKNLPAGKKAKAPEWDGVFRVEDPNKRLEELKGLLANLTPAQRKTLLSA